MVTATSGDAPVVAWVWDQQSVWSQTANALKRRLYRWRSVILGLSVAAAVLVTLAAQVATLASAAGKTLAWAGAAAAAASAILAARTGRDSVQTWTRARSASEALKAETYLFLAGVAPYRGTDRVERLETRLDGILSLVDDLAHEATDVAPIVRELPDVHDVATYAKVRIDAQITGYYRPQARRMSVLARRYTNVGIALAIVSAVLSAGAATLGVTPMAAWLPVVTTVATAIAAYAGGQRHEALALEYARTAAQLSRLLLDRPHPTADPTAQDRFVHDCEHIISIQNEAWMAASVAATPSTTPSGPTSPTRMPTTSTADNTTDGTANGRG